MTALTKALDNKRKAGARITAVLERHYRPGKRIYWKVGEHFQRGEIVRTGMERVKVRNDRTGREYWLAAYRIVED